MALIREILDKSADLERIIGLLERLMTVVTAAGEQIPKMPKPERWQKLKHAQDFIGALLLANFQDYPNIAECYLEIKKAGPTGIILADGSRLTENDFILGLEAYCGLSDLMVANGVDRATIYSQCADRLDLLEENLETSILKKEDFLMLMDAFQMDMVSDAVRRVKKWLEKTVVTKLKELDAGMKSWTGQPSKIEERLQERLENRRERKTWEFKKSFRWALGFRKNLD